MATQRPNLRCRLKSNPSPSPPPILPNELITDILSRLRVKYLMQMKCVSKSWNSLISDPIFIKMHLNRSSLNPQFSLIAANNNDHSFVPFPVSLLWENSSINIPDDTYYQLNGNEIVGSCNGLVCLVGYSLNETTRYKKFGLQFWNPATRYKKSGLRLRAISDKLGTFSYKFRHCKFTFGYDNSTETYKVVMLASNLERLETNVKVFSLGDNVWRTIHGFPAAPLQLYLGHEYDGVHLSCTINWMAIQSVFGRDDGLEQFVIISLDLSTETFTQLMPPENYDNHGGIISPNICVLMDSLCFSYDKETEFFIWQMTKFGDDKSWSLFLKFSYHNVGINYKLGHPRIKLTPLHLSEDGDTLLLGNNKQDSAILYNWRNNRAKKTRINNKIWWFSIRDYVESLVPTC